MKWSLASRPEPAKLEKGKIPYFQPSVLNPDNTIAVQGGWRGGDKWITNDVRGPWGLPGVV